MMQNRNEIKCTNESHPSVVASCSNSFDILGESKTNIALANQCTIVNGMIMGDGKKGRRSNLPKTLKNDYVMEY